MPRSVSSARPPPAIDGCIADPAVRRHSQTVELVCLVAGLAMLMALVAMIWAISTSE
jgi:hypothetical protein